LRGWQDSRPSVENLHRVGPGLQLPDEIGRRRSAFWPWLKVDLLLFLMLLAVGAATLGVSLKARTEASTDAAPVNIKTDRRAASVSPDNGEPRQPITNGVKSPTATPSLPPPSPAPPNKQPVEALGPATPAASEAPALSPQCNIRLCSRLYRSFHVSDCTYQPSRGPRRICDR
jgi:hypothetical protein